MKILVTSQGSEIKSQRSDPELNQKLQVNDPRSKLKDQKSSQRSFEKL